jgi:hypothetical protein
LAVDQSHDGVRRAADVWNRKKCEHGGDRPAGDESLEPTRHKIGTQTDIGEGHHPAHHKDNERTDDDGKNEPGLAFH